MSAWSWVILGILGGGSLIALAVALFKSGRPLRRLLGTAAQGLCALAAVNVVGMFSGISLGLGWLTGAVAAFLGLPGVLGLLLCRLLFV